MTAFAVLLGGYWQVCAAQPSRQTTFPSAEEASRALLLAVETHDSHALIQILGQRNELISSKDADQDKIDRERFVLKYHEMHRLVRARNGEALLVIGAENWTFPIPLVTHNGRWRYDSDAGEREVLFRRIGENEVAAIEVCHALVASATKPQARADANDPVDTLLAGITAANKSVPLRGYYFRLLRSPSNNAPALVAYPAVYGSSGVMTFMVDDRGVVYQKDLGPSTPKVAPAMTANRPDQTWTRADTEFADSPSA
jgi:hypothetical protein